LDWPRVYSDTLREMTAGDLGLDKPLTVLCDGEQLTADELSYSIQRYVISQRSHGLGGGYCEDLMLAAVAFLDYAKSNPLDGTRLWDNS
jgi:hypothetical protein